MVQTDRAAARCLRSSGAFELRFPSLFDAGRALSFPCDATGHVDLNALSDRARDNYLSATALIGRDYAVPVVTLSSV